MRLATINIDRDSRTFVLQMPKFGPPSEDIYEESTPNKLVEIGFTYYDPDAIDPVLAASRLISDMQGHLAARAAQHQLDIQRLEAIREGLVEYYEREYEENKL